MKRIFFALLITLLTGNIYADAGNCVKYQVGVTLENGEYIEGHFFYSSYGTKFKFEDISIKKYLIDNCTDRKEKLTLYLKVTELNYPRLPDFGPDCEFHFNAVAPDDVKVIDLETISDIKLIEFNTCNKCDDNNVNTGFYWIGVYPNVITELTSTEIDLLNNKPYGSTYLTYPNDGTFGFKILSYNKSIKTVDLEVLCNDYLKTIKYNLDNDNWKEIKIQREEFKQMLMSKSIIMFEYGYAS